MLTVLRRLRRSLVNSSRFSKYLLYALGEVLLVVIGILIALQANQWNENRINRQKEKIYLKEILASLNSDLQSINFVMEHNLNKDSVINEVFRYFDKKNSNQQVALGIIRQMPHLSEYQSFEQNRVAFDNMISSETIDIISNDSLRIHLSLYYRYKDFRDGTQERVKQLTRQFVDNISPMLVSREYVFNFSGIETKLPSYNDLDYIGNSKIFGDLMSMRQSSRGHTRWLISYQKDLLTLIDRIQYFLEE